MVTESAARKKTAPYCTPATLLGIIEHFRNFDVPTVVAKERLTQIGVPDSLLNRNWVALVFLGLILEDGTTTEAFQNIRYAGPTEYATVLRSIMSNAYADIFQVLDPESADELLLEAAFRPYSPGGQRARMITLFLGLAREAGYSPKVQPKDRPSSAMGGAAPRQRAKKPVAKEEAVEEEAKMEEPPTKPAPELGGIEDVRHQYAALLLQRVQESDGDGDAMDRLERVLGVSPKESE